MKLNVAILTLNSIQFWIRYKEMTYCPNCGAKLEGTESFCPYCGILFKKKNKVNENSVTSPNWGTPKWSESFRKYVGRKTDKK